MRVRPFLILISLTLLLTGCSDRLFTLLEPQTEVARMGDVEQGQAIFTQGINGAPPCSTCHQTAPGSGGFSVGPNLHGLRDRAASRLEGYSAEAYVENSILHPSDYVVRGYQNVMFSQYSEYFSEQDMADVVAYLMGL